MKNNELDCNIIIISVLSIVIISIFSILSSLDEYIPPEDISFEIETNNLPLSDFVINHDFSKKNGEIKFKITREYYLNDSYIVMHFPAVVNKLRINILHDEVIENIDMESMINSSDNKTRIIIHPVPFLGEKENFYSITYNIDIQPSGHLTFNHPNTKLFGLSPRIYLNLGKQYKCSMTCLENPLNVDFLYRSTYREIKLEFKDDNGEEFHGFFLTGIIDNSLKENLIFLFLGICISLIIEMIMKLLKILDR